MVWGLCAQESEEAASRACDDQAAAATEAKLQEERHLPQKERAPPPGVASRAEANSSAAASAVEAAAEKPAPEVGETNSQSLVCQVLQCMSWRLQAGELHSCKDPGSSARRSFRLQGGFDSSSPRLWTTHPTMAYAYAKMHTGIRKTRARLQAMCGKFSL